MNSVDMIAKEEGFKSVPYLCSEGLLTVAFGKKLSSLTHLNPMDYNFSIPESVARQWLEIDVASVKRKMVIDSLIAKAAGNCSAARVSVLVSMAYQLGVNGLSMFRKMLTAIADGDWDEAEREGLDSRWATQTPERAKRQMLQLRTGEWDKYYC